MSAFDPAPGGDAPGPGRPPEPRPWKPTICVDFDGVLHSYELGWQDGRIYGTPIEGSEAALELLARTYRVVVFTARDDLEAVNRWLVKYGLAGWIYHVTNRKSGAVAYIDDRAIRFESWGQALRDFANAVPPPDDGYVPVDAEK